MQEKEELVGRDVGMFVGNAGTWCNCGRRMSGPNRLWSAWSPALKPS